MGKVKITSASYRPMPSKNRYWFYSENSYTAEELEFRRWVLNKRAASGIHPDYLTNPNSWFSDDDHALVTLNEGSWIYATSQRPRQLLTRDDFHIQPIEGVRLNCPELYGLMQQVGDYLLLRNQGLRNEHLNQPMNYVFLDINFMLKGLSQNSNLNQVKQQLEFITRYIRTIEKNVSPTVGSDRLFLVNFRSILNEQILPKLTHSIESRLLQDRLQGLSKLIKQVSTERNRILHFALNSGKVNPHSYEFAIEMPEDPAAYPTQAAKACLEKQAALPTSAHLDHSPNLLKDCAHFKLMDSNEELETHYAQAILDLKELEHFQIIITQINGLLEQAGEVYTIHQFKTQMLHLFELTHSFLEDSSTPIKAILEANTEAYHKAIQDQQDLSLWKKWFTSEEDSLATFIKNQDTLAQFPSGFSDLSRTNSAAQSSTREIIHHLSQPREIETSLEAISSQSQELDHLMGNMHHWIANRYQQQGLPAPLPPSHLQLAASDIRSSVRVSEAPSAFFSITESTPTAQPLYSNHSSLWERPNGSNNNALLFIGLFVALPVAIYGFYLLFKSTDSQEEYYEDPVSPKEQKQQFRRLITKFEDKLTLLKGLEQSNEENLSIEEEPFITTYATLKKQAAVGIYNINVLKEAYKDLKYFYKECMESHCKAAEAITC